MIITSETFRYEDENIFLHHFFIYFTYFRHFILHFFLHILENNHFFPIKIKFPLFPLEHFFFSQ